MRWPRLTEYWKASGNAAEQNAESDSEEEEQIYVTRQEEERDPEAEAEFDRAFEKMMAESLDSRKFERKTMFDVPLPMRRTAHNPSNSIEESTPVETPESEPRNTMAFSLMTKRGNRQQVSALPITNLQQTDTLTLLLRRVRSIFRPIPVLPWL